MFEGFKQISNQFTSPNIEKERGEFDRVASEMNLDTDTLIFLAKEEGRLVSLDKQVWSKLENTDSNRFEKNNWDAVQRYSEEHSPAREWQILKDKLESGIQIDAPIIMKYGDIYHLVSGNTRLMVARSLGIIPKVLMFEYIHDRTNEKSS